VLDNDVSTLKRRLDRMDLEVSKKNGRDDYGSEARDDSLSVRVTELEVSVKLLENCAPSTGPDTPNLEDQIDALAKRVGKTEARGSEEVFGMDQFIYGSYPDFAQMVLDERVPTSGVFWDLFSVLVSMRPKGLSGKERADEQYSSERIKTTIFENNLLASTQ
jgi:hypothetical protein